MYAVLKILYSEKHFITEEECRRVREVGRWWFDELALTVAMKSPGVVQQALDALEGYTKEVWYIRAAQPIKGSLKYSCISDVVRMGECLLHLHALLQSLSLMNVHCSRCSMDPTSLPPLWLD